MPRQKLAKKKMPATSTPNTVSCRRSIHQDKTISPIVNDSNDKKEQNMEPSEFSNSSSETSETEESYSKHSIAHIQQAPFNNIPYIQLEKKELNVNHFSNHWKLLIPVVVLVCITSIVFANIMSVEEPNCNAMTAKELQGRFPSQSQYTFDAIISGINDVKIFNKPSVFLLLYVKEARQTVDDFVQVVAHYAANILNDDCKANPIILTSSSLNTAKAKNDYGHVISTYKTALEKRTVMIVKNLDKVSGIVAQAFHSICDEFSPLVRKSLIIFTMEINDINENHKSHYKLVESILRENWSELDDDKFYPLCTRITSMVLKIKPEIK